MFRNISAYTEGSLTPSRTPVLTMPYLFLPVPSISRNNRMVSFHGEMAHTSSLLCRFYPKFYFVWGSCWSFATQTDVIPCEIQFSVLSPQGCWEKVTKLRLTYRLKVQEQKDFPWPGEPVMPHIHRVLFSFKNKFRLSRAAETRDARTMREQGVPKPFYQRNWLQMSLGTCGAEDSAIPSLSFAFKITSRLFFDVLTKINPSTNYQLCWSCPRKCYGPAKVCWNLQLLWLPPRCLLWFLHSKWILHSIPRSLTFVFSVFAPLLFMLTFLCLPDCSPSSSSVCYRYLHVCG